MLNKDLIAHLQPAANQYDPCAWRDVTGLIRDISATPERLVLRAPLAPGLYRGEIVLRPGSFDMETTMAPLLESPSGERVQTGPWDLHPHGGKYMGMPSARVSVNGHLTGALWFAMPGPEQIKEGWLRADFGFEAGAEETELVLEFVEHDRDRICWGDVDSLQMRLDDRTPLPLNPVKDTLPRVYVSADRKEEIREIFSSHPWVSKLPEKLAQEELWYQQHQGNLDLAMLAAWAQDDEKLGRKALTPILELCRKETWSGRPDPLVMGGDNDRGIGFNLYYCAQSWQFLQAWISASEKDMIRQRVEEYLQKLYDFTVLQRGYMGCPTSDAHSLGAWSGIGAACMAFHDELAIARKALPFFHGLVVESLALFPPSGRANWLTYYPLHLVRYLAAAHTFGGKRPELLESPFLDNLVPSLLASFGCPNRQEIYLQERTDELRCLTAFLHYFHGDEKAAPAYRFFARHEMEKNGCGIPGLTIFDILYGPSPSGEVAEVSSSPLFFSDIGLLIAREQEPEDLAWSVRSGLTGGREASFHTHHHNREFEPSIGQIDISIDGFPVIVGMQGYQRNSVLLNTMSFEDGALRHEGQWLAGDLAPEHSAWVRRCMITDRFIYLHAVITDTLAPGYNISSAERIILAERNSGVIVIEDSYAAEQDLRFATHLHCSGELTPVGSNTWCLASGPRHILAGIKSDMKPDTTPPKKYYVKTLQAQREAEVRVAEANWIPNYIYGVNFTGEESIEDGRIPHIQRWRWEFSKPGRYGSLCFALGPDSKFEITSTPAGEMSLPGGLHVRMGQTAELPVQYGKMKITGAEAVITGDDSQPGIAVIGCTALELDGSEVTFDSPVDLDLYPSPEGLSGRAWAEVPITPQPEGSPVTFKAPESTVTDCNSAAPWCHTVSVNI